VVLSARFLCQIFAQGELLSFHWWGLAHVTVELPTGRTSICDFCFAWLLHYIQLLIRAICVSCYWLSQLIPKEASWNFIRHTDMAHRTLKVKRESLVTCKDPLSKRKIHSCCLRIKSHSFERAQVIGWPHKELCLVTPAALLVLVEQLFFNQRALTYKLKFPHSPLVLFFFSFF